MRSAKAVGRTKLSGWRKIASATWGQPNDPQVYGDIEIDATNVLAFIERARGAGHHLTVTHLVGKAVGYVLGRHPGVNMRLYRGHFVPRRTASVFFVVSSDAGAELSGVRVDDIDRKSAVDVAAEVARRTEAIRSGNDVELGRTKSMLSRTPLGLLRPLMRLATWLATDLQIDLPSWGLPREPFGSAMVTSVGMFGIEHAYAPLSPVYRFPFLLLVGEVTRKPVVVGDRVEPRPVLNITATLDHRYVDGFHAAALARPLREYLEDPSRFEPPLISEHRPASA